MRAPYQVLVFPYRRRVDGTWEFAVFRRADVDIWQGIAGGGEDGEAPIEAARREALEEAGIAPAAPFLPLESTASIPVAGFRDSERWDRYVIPEHAFGVEVGEQPLRLSREHAESRWLPLAGARVLVRFDSNRTALWELHQRLIGPDAQGSAVSPGIDRRDPPASYRRLGERIAELRKQGICPTCHDLATNELFSDQAVIADDDRFRVVLEQHPRARGHTIIVYKPHRDDFTQLMPDETSALFGLAARVANALKQALGAEKVYLVTMCDGSPNHLHLQLLPRMPGEPMGSRRLVAPRGVLRGGERLAASIRAALEAPEN